MRIIKSFKTIRTLLRIAKSENKKIGFIPTMGALHEGHLSLIQRCKRDNDITVVSIFVNPAQFGPGEDYRIYPRDKKRDCALAKKENVDIIFCPSVKGIYPDRYLTYIDVKEITNTLCGQSRPGHFQGVTTVVGKLLNIISPHVLYLGQKDAQQAVIIKKMIRDLNFPVAVKILQTVREPDGLAISSRNKYLSRQHRREATILYQSLCLAKKSIREGKGRVSAKNITRLIQTNIRQTSSCTIEYIACVNADSLKTLEFFKEKSLIALAVRFGSTRLIDNIIINYR